MATARPGYTTTHRLASLRTLIDSLQTTPRRLTEAEQVFLATAAAVVVIRARQRAMEWGGVAAKSAPDVKTGAKLGSIAYGGKPYNMGAEWGAIRYKQFRAWRGRGDDAGYFVWPAVREWANTDMVASLVRHLDIALNQIHG